MWGRGNRPTHGARRFFAEGEGTRRQAVINSADPIRLWQRFSLRIGDGNERHLGKFIIKQWQIGQVEPTMQSGQLAERAAPRKRKMEVIDMKMNEIELVGALKHVLKHQNVVGEGINRLAQPKRARRAGH